MEGSNEAFPTTSPNRWSRRNNFSLQHHEDFDREACNNNSACPQRGVKVAKIEVGGILGLLHQADPSRVWNLAGTQQTVLLFLFLGLVQCLEKD